MEALVYDVQRQPAGARGRPRRRSGRRPLRARRRLRAFGGWPKETVERLRARRCGSAANGERWTADTEDAPDNPAVPGAIAAARAAVGPQLVAELAALPPNLTRADMLICHGSPVSDVRSFFPEPAEDEAELLDGVTAQRLLFGHTHVPFTRVAHGIELINPGSMGMPFDGDPRAAYAVIGDDGSVEYRGVESDHGASAARVREHDTEWAEVVARHIERARPDV